MFKREITRCSQRCGNDETRSQQYGAILPKRLFRNTRNSHYNRRGYQRIDLMHNDVTRLDAREECWS